MEPMLVASLGGGVNSKAMLIEWHNRGERRPDAILFADTGGEKPATYAEVTAFSAWLESVGYPPVTTVRNDGMYDSLEDNCLKKEMLPSLAYGFKSCSEKYKHRPQEKYAKAHPLALATWAAGGKVVKLIGIDAGEAHRKKVAEDDRYVYRYPLVEWDIDRDECVKIIEAAGLPLPPKSSCFFCPAMTKKEIVKLADESPDLFARAMAMEVNAAPNLKSTKGLGRRFNWGEFIENHRRTALAVLPDPDAAGSEEDCMCYDG